jgi:hypothetical protein
MAWRKAADPFPAPLREFREEDWPPVSGEHLGHSAQRSKRTLWGRLFGRR